MKYCANCGKRAEDIERTTKPKARAACRNRRNEIMTLADSTVLLFQYPNSGGEAKTTWGEFKTVNRDDPEMISDIADQIAEYNYAEIGGGAAPLIWIFQ